MPTYEIRGGGDVKNKKQSVADLKYRRLIELNSRLREDLDRPRVKVSEASLSWVLALSLVLLPRWDWLLMQIYFYFRTDSSITAIILAISWFRPYGVRYACDAIGKMQIGWMTDDSRRLTSATTLMRLNNQTAAVPSCNRFRSLEIVARFSGFLRWFGLYPLLRPHVPFLHIISSSFFYFAMTLNSRDPLSR